MLKFLVCISLICVVISQSSEGPDVGACRALEDRIAALENAYGLNTDDDSELSNFEVLWQDASSFIYNLAQPTDEACTFNFKTGRCYPKCQCSLQYKFGDYSPTRSCRYTPEELIVKPCNETKNDPFILSFVASSILNFARAHSPPTDEECRFSFTKRRCVPESICLYEYQFGDFSPHRSCRLM